MTLSPTLQTTSVPEVLSTRKNHYSQSSAFRATPSQSKDLLSKAREHYQYAKSMKDDGVYAYRIVARARKPGLILAETEFSAPRWLIDCTPNDYLSLSSDPTISEAVNAAVQKFGVSSQGASMLNGNCTVHIKLEDEIASYFDKEAVILTPSGFQAAQGALQGLLRPGDVCFADQYNHASLNSGMQISGAKIIRYPHLNLSSLQQLLESERHKYQGAMIVTDGVFSTEGTVANVEDLVTLARAYDCRLVVDDAHGVGVLNGGKGCGALEGVDILVGTLGKAFIATGGFIAGSKEAIEYLRFYGAASCATTNISVPNAAAATEALKIVRAHPERADTLLSNVKWARYQLRQRGVNVLEGPSPIINVVCGTDAAIFKGWRRMFEAGVLCHAMPYPFVPLGHSSLRFRITYSLTREMLQEVIDAIVRVLGPETKQVMSRL